VTRAEHRFQAMGTQCHIVVIDGPPDTPLAAEQAVRDLESRWSRFIETSDVARLNAANGEFIEIAPETADLIGLAAECRLETNGWFDPFLAADLVALGYDRTMEDVRRAAPAGGASSVPAAEPAIGEPLRRPSPVRTDAHGRVALVDGVAFDPGGIGKGRTADLVAAAVMERGASGVLVNIGGDLRVEGTNGADAWVVAITNPFDEAGPDIGEIAIAEGGVATSSPLRRRWRAPDGTAAHHILDPRTARPAHIELASLTVAAPDAASAEVLATAVMLAGPYRSRDLLDRYEARAFAVRIDGTVAEV
jgi:thiamine biosynthesis lipoprotein